VKLLRVIFCLSILVSTPTVAWKNYASNLWSPIPPGCATNWEDWGAFNPSGTEIIFQGHYPATKTSGTGEHDMGITVWRKGCPNSSRSVLMLDLEPIDDNDGITECLITPTMSGVLPNNETKIMRGVGEPHTNSILSDLSVLCEGNKDTLFIETITSFDGRYTLESFMNPIEYNGAWRFVLEDLLTGKWGTDIPAYTGSLAVSRMALTGRLSGTWVVPNITDQGFVLAFEELTDPTTGLLFLSWYTFDANGKLLWLTGAGTYAWGDTEVSMNIDLVENGEFMGTKVADRSIAGTATVVALNCNNLQLTYNLNQLGLGSATKTLVRIFSAETQGYACSDAMTRIIHESDG
jgi:hypothetical protein